MKILFCGTPDFAATILSGIYAEFPDATFEVLSSPARRSGRGMTLSQPPVAAFALEHGFVLHQPDTLKNEAFLPVLEAFVPDIAIVAAYGKILPKYFLDFPRLGCLNVHASLLPEYRGASPIQRSIWDGKAESGISIMQMDVGLDTGDVLLQEALPIESSDNTLTLTEKLATLGTKLIVQAIRDAFDGRLAPMPQDNALSTYAPKILREDEVLDFTKTARELDCQIRALAPRPYANTHLKDQSELKVCTAALTEYKAQAPGTIRVQKGHVFVSCADFELQLLTLKPQGKGIMDAQSLVNGRKIADGDILS